MVLHHAMTVRCQSVAEGKDQYVQMETLRMVDLVVMVVCLLAVVELNLHVLMVPSKLLVKRRNNQTENRYNQKMDKRQLDVKINHNQPVLMEMLHCVPMDLSQ